MRGFGAPQSLYVTETQMNLAAEELGIDPVDLRLKNAQVSGDQIPDVATISSCGFVESIEAVAKMSDWKKKRKNLEAGPGHRHRLLQLHLRRGLQLVQYPLSLFGRGDPGLCRRHGPSC